MQGQNQIQRIGIIDAIGIGTIALATLLLNGCGKSDCETACELAKTCPGAPESLKGLSCESGCEFQEGQSESLGCGDEFDAFNACAAALDSCENNNTACSKEALAWSECLNQAIEG